MLVSIELNSVDQTKVSVSVASILYHAGASPWIVSTSHGLLRVIFFGPPKKNNGLSPGKHTENYGKSPS